jgi:hypothetical protein
LNTQALVKTGVVADDSFPDATFACHKKNILAEGSRRPSLAAIKKPAMIKLICTFVFDVRMPFYG